jgi:hypothetical protein
LRKAVSAAAANAAAISQSAGRTRRQEKIIASAAAYSSRSNAYGAPHKLAGDHSISDACIGLCR